MIRSFFVLLLIALFWHTMPGKLALSAGQPAVEPTPLRPGMTPVEVQTILGPPARVSREIILYRVCEQWHYSNPPVRLHFDQRRGHPARLVWPAR